MGSQGPLAHVDLWSKQWEQWLLFGHSVTLQSVPSHVGVQGNERADEGTVRGFTQTFTEVLRDREVRDIWHDLGLDEMDDPRDDNE